MKSPLLHSTACLFVTLCMSATADTIYSNLQDIAIPTDFTGVSVTVNGGTINPFFGGVGVANNGLFQPVRADTELNGIDNLDTIRNLSVGSIVDVNSLFSTGSGGSQDHLGNTFTSGSEGFIGFKTGAGNYGWMRVVFTGNTAGAVIKDWAYDNSGLAINVGRIQQGAASGGAQLVTLSPGSGESFTLGSQITDDGTNVNSVLKTGAGTTVLTGNSTYTGTTTVSQGKLVVGAGGTGGITSNVTVASGATLGGSGTIAGNVTLDGGKLAAGNSPGTLTVTGDASFNSGSIFEWELASNKDNATGTRGTDFDAVNLTGADKSLTIDETLETGAVFKVVLGVDFDGANEFWTSTRSWDVFNVAGTGGTLFKNFELFNASAPDSLVDYSTYGTFSFGFADNKGTLTWSAVPEISNFLAGGGLLGLGLLRRRRTPTILRS